jgi:uncharacterized protein (TIGR02996 family)
MSDESAFLRAILAKPEDAVNRLMYADWLEQCGDPRAQFLRMDPALERISYVAWLESDGYLDFYLRTFPEVRREAEERQATAQLREQRRAVGSKLDPDWVAFINTFGSPFEPFFFFNNSGNPRECQPDELPFAEPIGARGAVITFEADFRDERSWDQGLMRDVGFLTGLQLENCYSGAATCPVHPFICELNTKRRPLTGADVIASARPRSFRSTGIQTLDVTSIPYPGYDPSDGSGIHNDEIHNDFQAQYIFQHSDEDSEEKVDALSGAHGVLRRHVAGSQLWYVLLHTAPQQVEEFQFSRYAILLAVGQSPTGDRLIGVVTHQVCHNLCD